MIFSWKALLLSPLPIPLILSALLTLSSSGNSPSFTFFFFFALGGILSYGVTLFLFLPCLFIVSRFASLSATRTAALGTALGVLVYIPVLWQSYRESGVDSGPPPGTFLEYARHHAFGSDFWAFLISGLITSLLYWLLAKPSPRKENQPAL